MKFFNPGGDSVRSRLILMSLPLLFAFFPGVSLSQDTIRSTYRFDLTGVVNSVNGSTRTIVTTSAQNSIKWGRFESTVNTDYQLISDNGVNSINDFSLRIQPRIIGDKYSIFSFGQMSSLESKKITQRFEGGLGGGVTLLRRKTIESTLSYGVLYYNNSFQDQSQRKGFRHSPRIQIFGKIESYRINYSVEGFYQPSIQDNKDYIFRSKSTLGFELNKKFTISGTYSVWFESFYVVGSRNDIRTLTIGTTYRIE